MNRSRPRVFGDASWTLDKVWDEKTGRYFRPWIPPEWVEAERSMQLRALEEVRKFGLTIPAPAAAPQPPLCAIIDTGILSSHPMIKGTIVDSVDYTGEGPEDVYGHGTIVTLHYIMSAQISSPDERPPVLNVKVMDRLGNCKDEWIANGIRWSVDKGALLINLSIGYDTEDCQPAHATLCEAIEYAEEKNVSVIVASEARCPAQCAGVIVAGGMLFDGQMIKSDVAPTIVAPGQCYMVPV